MARTLNLVLYGEPQSGIQFNVGETTSISCLVQDLVTRLPVPLAGATIALMITAPDMFDRPEYPVALSIVGAVSGDGTAGAFTASITTTLPPGNYFLGCQITIAGSVTNYLPLSRCYIAASVGFSAAAF